jgi:predicted DCC family thiol-disulfide oxidoreductase YuxK
MVSLVIYDSNCPYCTLISKVVNLSSRFDTMAYNSSSAQEILEKEFEDPGFTFYMISDQKVYFGDKAAQKIAVRLYRSKIAGKVFLNLYPYLSKTFSVLSGGRSISQPTCTEDRCIVKGQTRGVVERTNRSEELS